MTWLITGGCGFIGRNLIKRLRDAAPALPIRVVDDLSVGTKADLDRICNVVTVEADSLATAGGGDRQVQLVVGDIRDGELAKKASQGASVIVHLAANTGVAPSVANPLYDCTVNVIGTVNYLEAARAAKVSRFVFASSGAPIGDCNPPLHEELPAHPVSPYGASKLAGEAYCSAYKRSFGVDTVCLRFSNVYGPLSSHKSSVVAKFIREALAGKPWEIYGDGGQTRDFVYVDDLVEAIELGARKPGVGGEVFQIATNTETSVDELAGSLRGVLAAHGIKNIELRHGAVRVGDVRRNFADTSKARRMLGWEFRHSLEDGLDRTVRWFLDEKAAQTLRAEDKSRTSLRPPQ